MNGVDTKITASMHRPMNENEQFKDVTRETTKVKSVRSCSYKSILYCSWFIVVFQLCSWREHGLLTIHYVRLDWFMVFNATFNNISVILWRSVLLVEETGVPEREKNTDLSHVTEYTSPWTGFELTPLVVIGSDCTASCKSYHHTRAIMAPIM
jgi:hypothetical protein